MPGRTCSQHFRDLQSRGAKTGRRARRLRAGCLKKKKNSFPWNMGEIVVCSYNGEGKKLMMPVREQRTAGWNSVLKEVRGDGVPGAAGGVCLRRG